MTLGWQCPVCGACYAPAVTACPVPHAASRGNDAATRGTAPVAATSHEVVASKASKASKASNSSKNRYTYTEEFERFFKIYPNTRGKYAASRRFAEALKSGITVDELCRAAAAYRDDPNRNPDKTKHAQGWLHDRRWEDELGTVAAPTLAAVKSEAEIEEERRRRIAEEEQAVNRIRAEEGSA